MSIVVTDNLIVTNHGFMTLGTAKVLPTATAVFVIPTGNTLVVDDYIHLDRKTRDEFTGITEAHVAKKAYEGAYENWAQFRRSHRHEIFMILPRTSDGLETDGVKIVNVDNLYLDKMSIGVSTLLWKHGVRTIRPNKLHNWLPEPPGGWVRRTWSEIINRR